VTIVVGVDGSAGSRRALAWALDEARLRKATLRVVHAWGMPYGPAAVGHAPLPEPTLYEAAHRGAEHALGEALAGIDARGVTVESVLVEAVPAAGLLHASADADLLVVGTRGHGGFVGMLLGSVGHHVSQHAHWPVVIVPPEER
jgi:nucleotide-binding universal stress UspA family protein